MGRLDQIVRRLENLHGVQSGPPASDPYRLMLWEYVAYLADDVKRLAAYQLLVRLVGTEPEKILAAPRDVLLAVTRAGGSIAADVRAKRIQDLAARVADDWNGDLSSVLRLPFEQARKELAQFPSVGEAGAERILLLCGAHAVLGLESNSLRVLVRLGYGSESDQWSKMYKGAQAAADPDVTKSVQARRRAFLQLRVHGQKVCRRTKPLCHECPLQPGCPSG
jgi:endonuclease III